MTALASPGAREWSLRRRLLISITLIAAVFLLLAGAAVDRAFRSSVSELAHDRLLSRSYLLMGAAEIDGSGGFNMSGRLAEPQLFVPDSGVYGAVADISGQTLWHSESSVGEPIAYPGPGEPGQATFGEYHDGTGAVVLTLSYPVYWELESGLERVLVFQAAQNRSGLDVQVDAFRHTLSLWLGGTGLLLLLVQAGLLSWSLAPMRRVAGELGEVEAGRQRQLGDGYPSELAPLTENLNAMILSNRRRLQRYRDSLGDLAHSLKTPAAVLRSSTAEALLEPQKTELLDQLNRIDETIEYQLQRAAVSGHSPLANPVSVVDEAARVKSALEKIYRDRNLRFDWQVEPGTIFYGDPGDLSEILGNLCDNACKWANSQVRLRAHNEKAGKRGLTFMLVVEDDGPGIAESQRAEVLSRGVRADARIPGQGIGLAMVRGIVAEVYGGSLEISESSLGGSLLRVSV